MNGDSQVSVLDGPAISGMTPATISALAFEQLKEMPNVTGGTAVGYVRDGETRVRVVIERHDATNGDRWLGR